jgi:hypothetical protein
MHVLKDDQLLSLMEDIKTGILDGYVDLDFDTDESVRWSIAHHIALAIKQTQIEAFARAVAGKLECDGEGQVLVATNFYSPTLQAKLEAEEDAARTDFLDDDEEIEVAEADPGG